VLFVQKIKSNVNENANDAWLTGIVEVELPMEEKLRNIEETERAKKKMLEDRQKGLISSGFRVDTSSDKGYMRIGQKAKKKGAKKPDDGPVIDASKKLSVLPSQPVHGGNNNSQYEQKREVKDPAAAAAGIFFCACVCVCVCRCVCV
jgi:hypothetical protein